MMSPDSKEPSPMPPDGTPNEPAALAAVSAVIPRRTTASPGPCET